MWWDLYRQSKTHVFHSSFKQSIRGDGRFSDADRGVLLIMALVITPVVIVATLVVGLSG